MNIFKKFLNKQKNNKFADVDNDTTFKELTDTEYNKKVHTQMLHEIDCLKGRIDELFDWSSQCSDGFFVYEPRIDSCVFFLDSIIENLKKNYQKSTVVKCGYCGQGFTGYFAKERESDHACNEHGDAILLTGLIGMAAFVDAFTSISPKDFVKGIRDIPNKASFKGRNIK